MGFLESYLGVKGNHLTTEQMNKALEAIGFLNDRQKYSKAAPEFEKIKHPSISYSLAEAAFALNLNDEAKRQCLNGATHGLRGDSKAYSDNSAEFIGQCLSLLLTQFKLAKGLDKTPIISKATFLSYIYLSKDIALNPSNSQRSRMSRFVLIHDHFDDMTKLAFRYALFGKNSVAIPYITDLYYAAAELEKHDVLKSVSYRQLAKEFRKELSQIAIKEVRGSEIKLKELAKVGEIRHQRAFEKFDKQYLNGEYNITLAQLASIFSDAEEDKIIF